MPSAKFYLLFFSFLTCYITTTSTTTTVAARSSALQSLDLGWCPTKLQIVYLITISLSLHRYALHNFLPRVLLPPPPPSPSPPLPPARVNPSPSQPELPTHRSLDNIPCLSSATATTAATSAFAATPLAGQCRRCFLLRAALLQLLTHSSSTPNVASACTFALPIEDDVEPHKLTISLAPTRRQVRCYVASGSGRADMVVYGQ